MSRTQTISVVVLLLALVTVSLSVFVVDETERAIRLRLGEIVTPNYEPGLHFKVPFVDQVRKFESRIMTVDAEPERYLTSEKKILVVDSFTKWRITEPDRYYTSVRGSEAQAIQRLSQIIKDNLRSEFGKRDLQDVVAGERKQIMEILSRTANERAQEFGIEVVDLRLKRVDLSEQILRSVYSRMQAERERVARELRSQGAEAGERIRADADRQRTEIRADAERQAQNIRGAGDARAAEIYAKAHTQDPEFFSFYRSLNAYSQTFKRENDFLVVDPESDFFRYFKDSQGRKVSREQQESRDREEPQDRGPQVLQEPQVQQEDFQGQPG